MNNLTRIFLNSLFFFGACLVILLPSFLNGFPILFSDTGTYIVSGMQMFVPIDRPVFYGMFIRVMSFYTTLWGVVIAQALIMNLFVLAIIKYMFPVRRIFLTHLLVVILLSLTTSYAYFANHMIPDFFSALLILGLALLIARPQNPGWLKTVLLLLLLLCNLVHLSNLLITTSLAGLSLVTGLLLRKKEWVQQRVRAMIWMSGLVLLSWIIPMLVNHSLGVGYSVNRVRNIFIMGSHIESGLMASYLNEACEEKDYTFCRYADSLPESTAVFLWDGNSPLYRGGCMEKGWESCWLDKDKEYGVIIHDMITTPRFLSRFLIISLRKGISQNLSFNIQHRSPEGGGSPVHYPMETHFPKNYENYMSARQQQEALHFDTLTLLQYIMVAWGFIFLLTCMIIPRIRRYIPVSWKIFTISMFISVVTNGFVTAIFSHVTSRYQSRVIWVIPLVAILFLCNYRKIGLAGIINQMKAGA